MSEQRPLSGPEAALRPQHNHRAPGPGGLPNELLSHAVDTWAPHIAGVFNGIFETAPAVMSQGIVGLLLPKPCKPRGPLQSLRPVNLLAAFRKTTSTLVLHRMRPILEKYVGPYQSGFRPSRMLEMVQ